MAPFGTLYTLHDRVHPRSRKILAAAKLNGLELTIPPFEMTKTNRTPAYLSKFPLGKIPSFESAAGLLLTESNAIAHHVAESGPRRDRLLGATPAARARVQQWVFFNELQLEPALFQVGRWRFGLLPYDQALEGAGVVSVKKWLDFVEMSIKGKKWLVGDDDGDDGHNDDEVAAGPSLADITIAGAFYFGFLTYVDAQMRLEYPEIMRWYGDIRAVPELTELFTGPMVEERKQPPN